MRRVTMGAILALASGCGAPAPPDNTPGGPLSEGRCGRGLAVVQSDYQSTNVSVLGRDGTVVSSSLLSSGSADPGLSAALSGDVTPPTARVAGDDLVLIDRYPASVITWVDFASAEVRAQLDVRTGFSSNPQDYLRVAEGKAYVSRYETNPAPGAEPHDEGGDVLIVDPREPAITGRLDMSEGVADVAEALPRPSRMVALGERVAVLLEAVSADFSLFADSRVALVDPRDDAILDVLTLDGLKGCWGAAVAPFASGASPRLAVTCNGGYADFEPVVGRAGVSVLRVEGETLVEETRVMAEDILGQALGPGVAFADTMRLLVVAMGDDGGVQDALVALDLDGGSEVVMRTESTPFSLGDVRCMGPLSEAGDPEGCGTCWVADAERGVVHRLSGASMEVEDHLVVDAEIGLPPRALGRL